MTWKKYINTKKIVLSLVAVVVVYAFTRLFSTDSKPPVENKEYVKTAFVEQRDISDFVEVTGSVESSHSVDIIPQVSGVLSEVHVRAGQDVKKGDLLFSIDSSSYQAALDQAKAIVDLDRVNLNYANKKVERYKGLAENEYVSESDFDGYVQTAKTSQATLDADLANLETAEINLAYCKISSSIDGKVGDILIESGNYLTQGSDNSKLTDVRAITPVLVSFNIPERTFTRIKKELSSSEVKVVTWLPDHKESFQKGNLVFVDNEVNQNTGTLLMKGEFANTSEQLWPGQFVYVNLQTKQLKNQLLAPMQSVLVGPNGYYVFVVDKENRCNYRIVEIGKSYGDLYHIKKGVSLEEQVVTQGQLNLNEGTLVNIIKKKILKKF
jgi:membrane fusion protein, multidrug efflux system